jgi:hypothetical protein
MFAVLAGAHLPFNARLESSPQAHTQRLIERIHPVQDWGGAMFKESQNFFLLLPVAARLDAAPQPVRTAPKRSLKDWSTSRILARMSLILAALALPALMPAQSYVFSSASFPTGLRPIFVASGDFNADGIQDVVVVNECGSDPTCSSAGSVSVLLGKPDGTFQSHVDYPVGSGPAFAVVGDFNNDGKPDIAVTNSGSNTVSILLGKGDGTFQTPVTYNTGTAPVSAVIGDFNHDGSLDLALANSGSNSVSVLLGNGDGTFRAHADFAVNFTPQNIAAADLNGDGKLDLIVADLNVTILLGNGDGTFQTAVDYPGNSATFVVAGDWNGDGKIDVAAVSGTSDTITVLKGNGNGTLQTPYTSYEVGGNPVTLVAVDLDGDGHPDLAVGTGTGATGPNQSATVSVLLNKGDGTFQLHGNFGGMVTRSLVAADFNGDGLPDIAVPDPDFNTVNITLGDGHGGLGSIFDVLSPPDYPTEVVARDFNGDGKLDLAMGLQGSGSVAVALGNGDGTFQSPIVNVQPGGAPRIAAADFNGDGKIDVAEFISSVINNVQILLGNGDGTFQTGSAIAVSNMPGVIVSGDFNGDGKMDLATVGFGVVILLGNGDGTFQTPISFSTRNSSSALVSDFNKDGKLDLAILSPDFTTLTVFLGNGDGTFQAGVDYATGTSPVGLSAADLNGDGNLDLAVVNAGSDTVSVFLGNGDGTFQNKVDFTTIQGPRSVAVADFDGDGHPDLIVTGNGVAILFGKGDGTFNPHQDYFSALDMGPAIAADLDGDGQPDLVAVNPFAASISAFLNRAAVALRPAQLNFPTLLVGASSTPQSVTVYNPGIFPLRVQSISMTGDFSQTNTCGSSVAGGTNCLVNVTFTPTSGGPRTGAAAISDNAPGGKQSVSLAGNAMDFSLAAAMGANCPSGGNCSTSATVSAGQSATYDLQVTPVGGFNQAVTLSCGVGSSSTTCMVSLATVPPSGSSSYAFAVTVANTSKMAAAVGEPSPIVASGIAILRLTGIAVLVLIAILGQPRKRRPVMAFLLLSLGLLPACGGGKSPVPPTHATITVTATSGGQNRTLQLSLTINH